MGWLKKAFKKSSKIAGYTPFTGFGAVNEAFSNSGGGTPAGSVASTFGYQTPAFKGVEEKANAKSEADAAAAQRQAEFEASARAGLERLALRRRRGFAASMIVDPGSSMGTTSTLGV